MDISTLKSLAETARHDPSVFEKLASTPEELIKDFDEISERVEDAIVGMSPEAAMADLLSSPSNAHCIRTSCGGSSFAAISD